MELVAIVVGLALIECLVFAFLAGSARGRYGVEAPAVTGHPVFERYFRVHQNTVEQLVLFVPGVFLFGRYVSPPFAAILGAVYLVGRLLYLRGYVRDPAGRGPGFLLSMLPTAILLLGGVIGAVVELL